MKKNIDREFEPRQVCAGKRWEQSENELEKRVFFVFRFAHS